VILLRVRPRADADVDEAADYYAEEAGPDLALRFLDAVEQRPTSSSLGIRRPARPGSTRLVSSKGYAGGPYPDSAASWSFTGTRTIGSKSSARSTELATLNSYSRPTRRCNASQGSLSAVARVGAALDHDRTKISSAAAPIPSPVDASRVDRRSPRSTSRHRGTGSEPKRTTESAARAPAVARAVFGFGESGEPEPGISPTATSFGGRRCSTRGSPGRHGAWRRSLQPVRPAPITKQPAGVDQRVRFCG